MNRQEACELVQKTFKQAFDENRFSYFCRSLVNHLDTSEAALWDIQRVKDVFKDHVLRYERLGAYTSLRKEKKEKLEVLIVHLASESKLERARTAIRNFVADYLKSHEQTDAALVAFVPPEKTNWRFSYIKMEYAANGKNSGKVGVETHLTPARRFSYLVGEGENCHTAQTRFLALLQDTEVNPTLADIEEAFSVEAVTEKFFDEYEKLFEEIHEALDALVQKEKHIRDEFKAKCIDPEDFAKKLLGQIVFLYFLQKKGWLGVAKGRDWGNGARNFLRQQADGKYKNFFNDILEPLFYDTLAKDRRPNKDWCEHFECRIPFLNSGLFEPLENYDWRKVNILLPNRLFTNSEPVDDDLIGTGVLDVFDRYNFTVNEAEPLEKEVAVDPLMLSIIFERLIKENRRRGQGAYFTPCEIVQYMCKESLVNYLDRTTNKEKPIIPRKDIEHFVYHDEQIANETPTSIEQYAHLFDGKLAEVTVCDPAVGSGAFPVSMITEIVRARLRLNSYLGNKERTSYNLKRHAIQNCIYGVDIDKGAVEIAKLRIWLSLVVDEDDVKQIKPLPNLEYKIVTGNSLLGVEKNLFNSRFFKRLEELKTSYFDETDSPNKASYKREIDDLIHQLTNGKEIFDFEIHFSEVFRNDGGFDIVIGNPPYISAVVHATMDGNNRNVYRSKYPLLEGAFDIYTVFLLQGVAISSERGNYSWIVPNRVLVSTYSKRVLDHLKRNGLRAAIDVSKYGVFENTGVYPIILIGSKSSGSFTEYEIAQLADLQHNRLVERVQLREFRTFKDHHIKIASGTTGFQAQEIVPCLSEAATESSIPFVVSGSINRYDIDFCNVRYMGRRYKKAFIKKNARVADSKWEFWKNEKIVIAGMTKVVEAVYYTKPLALGVGVYAIHDYGGFDPRFLLALLNSRFLSYYLNVKFKDKHLAGGYLAINKSTIEQLPLVAASRDEQKPLIGCVDQIISAKQRDPKADTAALEREIDRLVFKLYDLTPEEKAIVEEATRAK